MTEEPQDAVAALVPGAGGLGLLAPSGSVPMPATVLTDQAWIERRVAATAARFGIEDPRVAATVEWYSASAVALTPVLAGLATGRWLSARLVDTTLYAGHAGSGASLLAAVSSGAGRAGGLDPAETLREMLVEVIGVVARAGRMRERPLWAIATDSIADRLLALGRALGQGPGGHRAGRAPGRGGGRSAAGTPVRRRRRRPVRPPLFVLPALPGAAPAVVRVVSAARSRRAARPARGGRRGGEPAVDAG